MILALLVKYYILSKLVNSFVGRNSFLKVRKIDYVYSTIWLAKSKYLELAKLDYEPNED